MAEQPPLILFGAFDRHNFGDLLLAHVAAAQNASRPLLFAGLAARDLTPFGGHRVRALAELAANWNDAPADLLHVGGETLTCTLYEAAVMLLAPAEARAAIARHDRDAEAREAWARSLTGLQQAIAYLAPKALFRNPGVFRLEAIGGVAFDRLPPPARAEALARLREADTVSARDHVTLGHLRAAGIEAALRPDPATLTAKLFGSRIAAHGEAGEPAAIKARFPDGYLAVQFSADLGDDATLAALARQFDALAVATGLALVLFRAGAAPWHDDLEVYGRLIARLRTPAVACFESLNLWDICALLAQATGYCGGSLHGRIVAEAFHRPAVNLACEPVQTSKQSAYAATWAPPERPGVATIDGLAAAMLQALSKPAPSPAGGLESLPRLG